MGSQEIVPACTSPCRCGKDSTSLGARRSCRVGLNLCGNTLGPISTVAIVVWYWITTSCTKTRTRVFVSCLAEYCPKYSWDELVVHVMVPWIQGHVHNWVWTIEVTPFRNCLGQTSSGIDCSVKRINRAKSTPLSGFGYFFLYETEHKSPQIYIKLLHGLKILMVESFPKKTLAEVL